jgi:hypothetical protein
VRDLVPVGKQEKCADDEEAEGYWEELGSGEKSDGVADESDEREGADSAEEVGGGGRLLLLAFKSDQERQEEDEKDLEGVRGKQVVEVHSAVLLSLSAEA